MTTAKELNTINCLRRGFRNDATGRSDLLQLPIGLCTNVRKDLRRRVGEIIQELGTNKHIKAITTRIRNAKYKVKRGE
jgi:hypothetical protein